MKQNKEKGHLFTNNLWIVYDDRDIKISHNNFRTIFKSYFKSVKAMGILIKQYFLFGSHRNIISKQFKKLFLYFHMA